MSDAPRAHGNGANGATTPCLVAGARTPFAKAADKLRRVPAAQLGIVAVREAIARSGFVPEECETVIVGNVATPADSANIARVIAVGSGIPERVPAHTVSRNCASGMEAVAQAAAWVASGRARVAVAAGVESMSNIPLMFPEEFKDILFAAARARSLGARLAAWSRIRPRHFRPIIGLERGLNDPLSGLNMGQTAEILAAEFGIAREAQDLLALESHRRAVAAVDRHREEMAPVFLPPDMGRALHEDVGPRPNQTIEALRRLKPYFDRERGTITPGNASPITDGAAAVVIATADAVRAVGARPLARVRAAVSTGLSPRRMGLGPAYAVPQALDEAGATLADVDLVEINEAFAAQVIACVAALDSDRFCREELGRAGAVGTIDPDRTNVNGGAIALGHPVGASGARLVLTLAMEMHRRSAGLGLATLCVGGGQGSAVILEAA